MSEVIEDVDGALSAADLVAWRGFVYIPISLPQTYMVKLLWTFDDYYYL